MSPLGYYLRNHTLKTRGVAIFSIFEIKIYFRLWQRSGSTNCLQFELLKHTQIYF